jgi:hypothetical protein
LHQNSKWRSALQIIVDHEVTVFASDAIFSRLISDKWASFGEKAYLRRTVFPYLILLSILTSVAWLRGREVHYAMTVGRHGNDSDVANITAPMSHLGTSLVEDGSSAGSTTSAQCTKAAAVTLSLELVLAFVYVPFLLWKGWRRRRIKMRDLDTDNDSVVSSAEMRALIQKNLQFILDVLGAIAIIISFFSKVLCSDTSELQWLAVACLLLYCNLLNVLFPFKSIGVQVFAIYHILLQDFSRFLSAYLTFLFAFTWGLFLLMQRSEGFYDDCDQGDAGGNDACLWEPQGDPGYLFLRLLWASFGDSMGVIQVVLFLF